MAFSTWMRVDYEDGGELVRVSQAKDKQNSEGRDTK